MSLSYSDLSNSVDNIKSQFIINDEWRFGKVQKIYSSGKLLSLAIRVPGKTIQLVIGRGADACGVWLMDEPVPSPYRIVKDRLLEYLRSNIRGKAIEDIVVDELDRSVCIKFIGRIHIYLAWYGRKLHFSHLWWDKSKKSWMKFSPWENLRIEEVQESSFSIFDSLGRKKLEIRPPKLTDYNLLAVEVFKGGALKSKTVKKSERKVMLIEKDLRVCQKWAELQNLLVQDQLDLSQLKFKWNGIKCKFDREDTHFQRRDKLFRKVKKLKIGEQVLKERLKSEKAKLSGAQDQVVEQKIIHPVWNKQKSDKISLSSAGNNEVKYFKYEDLQIAIGLNSKANDWIRKDWAKKSDIWMHLDEYKSSHLFIKGDHSFSMDLYSLFASILADFSDFQADVIPIIFTQVSNLKGIKGKSGLVNYKKEKHLSLPRVNWKEIISMGW